LLRILAEIQAEGIEVIEFEFEGNRRGLYCDNIIFIDPRLGEKEMRCVLLEEFAHHHTTYGNILDLTDSQNSRQERIARQFAYEKGCGLHDLINAVNKRIDNLDDITDELRITEEFFLDSINYYLKKYGQSVVCNKHIVHFNPLYVEEIETMEAIL